MRSIHFDPDTWEDFLYWLGADRKMATRITRLIGEIQCEPFEGIGKPEPLKGTCPASKDVGRRLAAGQRHIGDV